ncbi:MAG: glycosyltransferase [Candidatus Muirbacterium halophilum]|nr:glycosyltransferase [Candidatus Muirbacterium halophilum]MCK9476396.1 glycosyltransferase [Candidatus Muirbacterium halophilum]
MKKIAIVVQRCGKDITGGSEEYAYTLGQILSEKNSVDIITTCAKDHNKWENHYKTGNYRISDNLCIKRFYVNSGRKREVNVLSKLIFNGITFEFFLNSRNTLKNQLKKKFGALPYGICEEWVRLNGPISEELFTYLKNEQEKYHKIFFMTYLYPTTLFGVSLIYDIDKVNIIPTFHDEMPVYLPVFKKYKKFRHFFLTNAEKDFCQKNLYIPDKKSPIIGFGIDDKGMCGFSENFALYAGRMEKAKNVHQLFDFFTRINSRANKIFLKTIGSGLLNNEKNPYYIKKSGFVSEAKKYDLFRRCHIFVHPSELESLGIVILEAMMFGKPCLVNEKCKVLKEHIQKSGAGFTYKNYHDFKKKIDILFKDKILYKKMSENARNYFLENYKKEIFKERLWECMKAV